MTKQIFQSHSNLAQIPTSEQVTTVLQRSNEAVVAAAASLLVGVSLRGSLTDRECEFLDSLAIDGTLSFLVQGDQFLHPDGLPLFPMEIIETAVRRGGGAVFTNHHTSEADHSGCGVLIYTACIAGNWQPDFVLGMVCSDHLTTRELTKAKFHDMVTLFRQAANSATKALQLLGKKLLANEPAIIVNRTSGYIMHLNEAACDQLDVDADDLVGNEYGQAVSVVGKALSHRKIMIENLATDDMSFSLLHLQTTAVPQSSKTARPPDIHNRLEIIIAAAQQIGSTDEVISPGQTRTIASVILDAARDANALLAETHPYQNSRIDNTTPSTAESHSSPYDRTPVEDFN